MTMPTSKRLARLCLGMAAVLAVALIAASIVAAQQSKSRHMSAIEAANYLVNHKLLQGPVVEVPVGPFMKELDITDAARVGCNIIYRVPTWSVFHAKHTLGLAASKDADVTPMGHNGEIMITTSQQCHFERQGRELVEPKTWKPIDPSLRTPIDRFRGISGDSTGREPGLARALPSTGQAIRDARSRGEFKSASSTSSTALTPSPSTPASPPVRAEIVGSSTSPWDVSADGLTTTLRTYTVRIDGTDHKIDIYPEFNDPEAAEHRLATTYANDVAALQKYLKLPKPTRETWSTWADALVRLRWQGNQKIAEKYQAMNVGVYYQFLSSSPKNRANRQNISQLIEMFNSADFASTYTFWDEEVDSHIPSTEANYEFYQFMNPLAGIPPAPEEDYTE